MEAQPDALSSAGPEANHPEAAHAEASSARAHVVSGELLYAGQPLKRQSIECSLWSPLSPEPVLVSKLKTDSKGRFKYRHKLLGKGAGVQRLMLRYAPGSDASAARVAFVELPSEWDKTVLAVGELEIPQQPLLAAGVVLDEQGSPMYRAAVSVIASDPKNAFGFQALKECTTEETGFFAVYGEAPAGSEPRLGIFHVDFEDLVHHSFDAGQTQLLVRLEHGIEVTLKLLLSDEVSARKLAIEIFPTEPAPGVASFDSIQWLGQKRKPHQARSLGKGQYLLGPLAPGSYKLQIRRRMSQSKNERLLGSGLSIAFATSGGLKFRSAGQLSLLFELPVEILREGDARELLLDPIDLREVLHVVRLTCLDSKGAPLDSARLMPLLDNSTAAEGRAEQSKAPGAGEAAEDAADPDADPDAAGDDPSSPKGAPGVATGQPFVLLEPEAFEEDGSLELILNKLQPDSFRVSAKGHVSQIVRRLERDTTLKLKRQILVQIQAPGLAQLPDGIQLEGQLVPLQEEHDLPQAFKEQGSLVLNYSKFNSVGELEQGVDMAGRFALWLRISVSGEDGRKSVDLKGPGEKGRSEVFVIAPAAGELQWSLSSSVGEAQLSEALRKLESKLWD